MASREGLSPVIRMQAEMFTATDCTSEKLSPRRLGRARTVGPSPCAARLWAGYHPGGSAKDTFNDNRYEAGCLGLIL